MEYYFDRIVTMIYRFKVRVSMIMISSTIRRRPSSLRHLWFRASRAMVCSVSVIAGLAILLVVSGCDDSDTSFDDPNGAYTKLKEFPNVWELYVDGPDGEIDHTSECRFTMDSGAPTFSSSLVCVGAASGLGATVVGEVSGNHIDFVTGLGTSSVKPYTGTIADDFKSMSGHYLVYPGYPLRKWEAKKLS